MGESGTRLVKLAVLVLLISLGGICKLKFRGRANGLLGVIGLGATLMSSFDLLNGSINKGEGERVALMS